MSSKIMSSFIWKYLERSSAQIVQFGISIVLARLLLPDEFGLIALVWALITLSGVFVDSGLKSALVQKKDASSQDFTTVFWLSLALAAIVYAVLFFAAPLIGEFYKKDSLVPIVRVLGLSLFFGSFTSLQDAYVQKLFLFKKMFFRSIAVGIPSGFLGITLAYFGFGVWALVGQYLASGVLMCVFTLAVVPWRPTFEFSVISAKKLFNFGYKLLLAGLVNAAHNNFVSLLIGKVFSPATLGFYNRGESFPYIIVNNVGASISAVMFPALANLQDDLSQFKLRTRMCVRCTCFAIFPLMALMASAAEPTVQFLLGEKWLPCVVFLQICCFNYVLSPLYSINWIIINSLGRSGVFLKLEVVKKVITISGILIALYVFRTPMAIMIAGGVTGLIAITINAFYHKKFLNYGFREQIIDIAPTFVLALICGLVVFPVTWIKIPSFAMVTLMISIGMALYISIAKMLKLESYQYIYSTLKEKLLNRNSAQTT